MQLVLQLPLSSATILMLALTCERRDTAACWGIRSNAAHPGLTKTNLQISGPSHGQGTPTLMARFYQFTWKFSGFMWQDVEMGILPPLYAAASPHAEGGAYYGPRGVIKGKAVKAGLPRSARSATDNRRLWELSERLTGVTYPSAA